MAWRTKPFSCFWHTDALAAYTPIMPIWCQDLLNKTGVWSWIVGPGKGCVCVCKKKRELRQPWHAMFGVSFNSWDMPLYPVLFCVAKTLNISCVCGMDLVTGWRWMLRVLVVGRHYWTGLLRKRISLFGCGVEGSGVGGGGVLTLSMPSKAASQQSPCGSRTRHHTFNRAKSCHSVTSLLYPAVLSHIILQLH